jgi:hypothetical protein
MTLTGRVRPGGDLIEGRNSAMTGYAENNGGRRGGLWRIGVWGGAAALLLAPLIAMRFTDEVKWTGSDFATFAVMLALPLAGLELAMRASASFAYRAAVAVALGAAFLMTWVNLAVGIIGDEDNLLNLLFFGVLAVGIVGAVIARFRPAGMARALMAMALAQALIAVLALITQAGLAPVVLTGAFAAPWLASAWLFGKAAS